MPRPLHDILSSLGSVTPDAEYTLRSRREILRTEPLPAPWYYSIATGWHTVTASPALTLALLMVVFIGGVGATRLLAPSTSSLASSLNAATLEAEAQAVDIQIALTRLQEMELDEQRNARGDVATVRQSAAKAPVSRADSSSNASSATPAAPAALTGGVGTVGPATSSATAVIGSALDELVAR